MDKRIITVVLLLVGSCAASWFNQGMVPVVVVMGILLYSLMRMEKEHCDYVKESKEQVRFLADANRVNGHSIHDLQAMNTEQWGVVKAKIQEIEDLLSTLEIAKFKTDFTELKNAHNELVVAMRLNGGYGSG